MGIINICKTSWRLDGARRGAHRLKRVQALVGNSEDADI